jgi:nucleoid-associated protein YgaU
VFEPTSRYAGLPTAELVTADGRRARYVARRFLPAASAVGASAEVAVVDGDRLDLIAARTLGDPEQYWRICDANDAMHPADLLAEPGAGLRVPLTDGAFGRLP